MPYNICFACKRLKTLHSKTELVACSARTKELTKNLPREKPARVVLPDPLTDRQAGRPRWH